jgi:hypothetical protein
MAKQYNGVSGAGKSIHIVEVFIRPDDSSEIHYLRCGTTNGGFRSRIRPSNKEVTCKKCLKSIDNKN